ncbi:exodeoxyribonuclease [Pectobacterium odoriferum]|uniref:Exodeoxyribonuclease n=1 Tax=Pectobacterium odoriferum TaxID=78398 RepID=A0ABR4VRQ3_9GAMM|nr:PD-(D/E)XK nuclease-like domain-containing protein [Pectobacterium odoriferum]KGA42021.1 exodeoxyribonuclease [Pectobacterium odoriferum]
MTPHAYFVEAYQKSGKKHLFIVLDAKNEARAEREVLNILDDNEIAVGRGADYKNPVRTHYPVFDDLPKDRVIDDTWCDRNMLEDDRLTWKKIPKPESASTNIQDDHAAVAGKTASTQLADTAATDGTITIDQASFIQRIGGGWLYESFTELSVTQQREISALQHDMEATYFQNLLLALNNAKELLQAQHCFPETLFGLIGSIKSVWPQDGKAPTVGDIVSFSKEWLNARNEDSGLERSGPYRSEVTARWAKKSGVQRTESGAIAGGDNKTDRNPDYTHTLDTLDVEIALATLPMDFDIYEIPVSLHRRAKEIIANKEEPFKTWSKHLRNAPAVLNYSRAAIFALIRSCHFAEDVEEKPESLLPYINANLVESDHANPSQHQLIQARHLPALSQKGNTSSPEPEIKNVGKGMFAIDGPMGNTPSFEGEKPENDGVDNVQMEAAGNKSIEAGAAVSASANDDGSIEEARTALESAVNKWVGEGAAAAEPAEPTATDEPPYFEPGRYEGVPNNDYHAANGISSTQVKDARISLMYYRGRHITKTIRRDSSDALTFGSLVHTLALEPEKLEEEYAIFPGVPAGAFTNTDTMKAWIREYNADKPKAEQLKLTGKKEELQEAIRAVNPEAIFADEFESQWRTSVSDKIILTVEQLQAATAIQQALFNHPTAGKLLQHPARAVEVSYFGMDDETGLEVRVRPDEELELNGLRIAADVKTISLGKVKQDNLRAKLHREIIDRDYHVSAAMYSEVADFDQFFWIFVNKDEGYHWVAMIEASTDLLELGSLEYHRTMRELANAYDTDTWPAPVTADYTDELNDFDQRRLEALRMA